MLQLQKYWWWLIALAALLIFFLGRIDSSLLPAAAQMYCEQNNQGGQQYCPTYGIAISFLSLLKQYDVVVTAIATAFIAYFTYTLKNVTAQLFSTSDEAAKAATKQAKLAEDAFTKLERPYLFIFGASKITQELDGIPFVSYSVANYGKTPAVIKHASAAISTGLEPDIPLRLDHTHNLFVLPVLPQYDVRNLRELLPDGIAWDSTYESLTGGLEGNLVAGGLAPRLTGQDDFFFWIIVTYKGPFTDHHETSACWRFDSGTNRLVNHGDGQY